MVSVPPDGAGGEGLHGMEVKETVVIGKASDWFLFLAWFPKTV